MPRSTSLVRRVAWGSALSASAAALLAALSTSVFMAYLVQRAEDRRLDEAAVTLAAELDEYARVKTVEEIVRDEAKEMDHTGMLFAAFDDSERLLAGDGRLGLPRSDGCTNAYADTLRTCWAKSSSGLTAVVASTHTTRLPLFAAAALLAVVLAAALAWVASRPISRLVISPLSRLRLRIVELDLDALSQAHLGPPEHVIEVDALRDTLGQLILRVERAVEQAHRFAANAAHELRTPLTSVRAELELLSESITDPELRSDVLRAQQNLVGLGVLVERLLILSVPRRAPTDAHEIVSLRDLLEDNVAALPASERERVQVSEADALVKGDAVLLSTMVANALANALKFGSQVVAGLQISGSDVIVHVDDDGPGVDATDRERAFEPFFRSTEALRRRLPGHGLGLALIRHIARTHGGDALFVDKSERGARLEIRLPAAEGQS